VIIAIIVLTVLLACACGALVWSIGRLIQLDDLLLDTEVKVERCLEVLDAAYRNIDAVFETPVASDEPLVRQVLMNILRARDAVHAVAYDISRTGEGDTDEEEHPEEQ